jgi:hypothetical protein
VLRVNARADDAAVRTAQLAAQSDLLVNDLETNAARCCAHRAAHQAAQPCRTALPRPPMRQSGRISGQRDASGACSVEPVELHRTFPPKATPEAVQQDAQTDALVAELRAHLAEMRAQRDAWQGIAERLALGAPKPPEPEKKPVSWWRWLRMTG